ncbi:hypothetical protein SAMN04488087_1691 [Rhodothermus profundi]|uniref:Uncharacterized protein n=1 Tax=Rhodothermus profundi TaxID=633813 RepID=A0A1M6UG23_9BACT|nr:hypothetical protein SAMN04488087_1691 [Rhodothermus profundi]
MVWLPYVTLRKQLGIALGLLLACGLTGYGHAQIRGGAEMAKFEPGDLVLYQEDLSGMPIGAQVAGWEIIQGSYEVAEFQDRRWFRPLTYDTHILRRIRLPQEFSVEFTAYFFEPGNAELRVFLHTAKETQRLGPDGPAQVYLIVGRVDKLDGFKLRKRVRPSGVIYEDVAARGYDAYEGQGGFPADRPHRIALQVRGGQLALFFDGERVAITPFHPPAPIEAISFRFLSRSGHALPYKDRPALLGALRVAGYSQPVGRAAGGVFLYWALPVPEERLPRLFAQSQTLNGSLALDALRQRYGWKEVTLVVVPLPGNPFGSDAVQVQLQEAEAFVQKLREELEEARRVGGGLVIVGDGRDSRTERERKLLARTRALAFAAWLAQQGIGNQQDLLRLVAGGDAYEALYLVADNGGYEGIIY